MLSCACGSAAPSTGWGLRGPRGDPPRGRDVDGPLRQAARGAGALVSALAAAATAGAGGEGGLAGHRRRAQARRAAFVVPPSGPNQVWQLDFTEFETTRGGTWRIGGVADYWSQGALGWPVSPPPNHTHA